MTTLRAMPARYIIVDPRVPQSAEEQERRGQYRYIGKYCRARTPKAAGTFVSGAEARASVLVWDCEWKLCKLVRRSLAPALMRALRENERLRQEIRWLAGSLRLRADDAEAALDGNPG